MKRILIISLLVGSMCVSAQESHPYFSSPEMPNALHYLPGPPQENEMRFAYDTAQYAKGKRLRREQERE